MIHVTVTEEAMRRAITSAWIYGVLDDMIRTEISDVDQQVQATLDDELADRQYALEAAGRSITWLRLAHEIRDHLSESACKSPYKGCETHELWELIDAERFDPGEEG